MELFGKRVEMPDGAIQLSVRTGAPIIGGYCRRIGHERYEIHLEEILDPLSDGHVDEEESIELLYNRIQDFISANRDQWCMFRDFWGDRI